MLALHSRAVFMPYSGGLAARTGVLTIREMIESLPSWIKREIA
jgi:hypothetical protein